MNQFSYSDKGLALTKSFEGLVLNSYQDSGGIWTIGYGHTPATPGEVWSQEQADAALVADIQWAQNAVNRLCTNTLLTQNQNDAMVDFCFNVGYGNFRSSTLLLMVNAGNTQGASQEFGRWVHAGGNVVPGLVARRTAEMNLFLEAS